MGCDYIRVANCQANCTVSAEWAPDGRRFLTAVLAPRMRVDNNITIWDALSGSKVADFPFEELYEAQWEPESFDSYRFLNITTAEVERASQELTSRGIATGGEKKKQAYRPPKARDDGPSTVAAMMRGEMAPDTEVRHPRKRPEKRPQDDADGLDKESHDLGPLRKDGVKETHERAEALGRELHARKDSFKGPSASPKLDASRSQPPWITNGPAQSSDQPFPPLQVPQGSGPTSVGGPFNTQQAKSMPRTEVGAYSSGQPKPATGPPAKASVREVGAVSIPTPKLAPPPKSDMSPPIGQPLTVPRGDRRRDAPTPQAHTAIGSMSHGEKMPCPAKGWQYIDPKKNIQGPFSLVEMQQWHKQGYFRPDLRMRCDTSDEFMEFAMLFPHPLIPFQSYPKRPQPRR